jgi:cell division protease FtsH
LHIETQHVVGALPKGRGWVFRRSKHDSKGTFQRALCGEAEISPRFDLAEVGGLEKARKELSILIQYIRDPSVFLEAGCDMPVGLLLAGRPGVGKTHLARYLADHSKIPFLHVDGSAFIEMYVGVGAARVRDLFRLARRQAPSIVFIDEIDVLAGGRSMSDNPEYYHTATQLLTEIDGFAKNPDRGVVVIGATSNPDALDPALRRPGRLHPTINIHSPSERELMGIFQVHLRKNHNVGKTQLKKIAHHHHGHTGAFVHQLVNRARVLSVLDKRGGKVETGDLEKASKQLADLDETSANKNKLQ